MTMLEKKELQSTSSVWVRHRSKLIIGLVLAQLIFLIGISLSYYAVGWYGKEIRLQTVPIDPTDLLYGDYVILKYDVNQLHASLWKGSGSVPKDGTLLYVVMKPDPSSSNGTFEAIGIYDKKPVVHDAEVILKGRSQYSYDDKINVEYGLEKYYVSENKGQELEKQVGKLIIHIKVAPWGTSVLDSIELPS
jgi:uncharacterized membrane-anchored protein